MKMVSLRDAVNVGLRHRSARRVERTCAAGGVWGGMPRTSSAIFSRGIEEEKNSEDLAAQIHHLIRKRFYHLIRKIILT
jgi:hypothetical protein